MSKYSIVPCFRPRLLKVSDNCYLLAVVRFPSDKFRFINIRGTSENNVENTEQPDKTLLCYNEESVNYSKCQTNKVSRECYVSILCLKSSLFSQFNKPVHQNDLPRPAGIASFMRLPISSLNVTRA